MPPKGYRKSRDPAWAHGQRIIAGNDHHVKCNYCNATMHAGINRLKYHLARILGNGVGCCQNCPDEVTTEMATALEAIKKKVLRGKKGRMRLLG